MSPKMVVDGVVTSHPWGMRGGSQQSIKYLQHHPLEGLLNLEQKLKNLNIPFASVIPVIQISILLYILLQVHYRGRGGMVNFALFDLFSF